MTFDVDALRKREFPWMLEGDAIFLNAASTGPMPQRAVEAVSEWARLRATPHKLKDETNFGTLKRARELIAALIGASPDEIALAVNTGYGVNLAARSLPMARGDVIISPHREFPANVYPWMGAARARGLEYRLIRTEPGDSVEDKLEHALDDPRVKCVAVSWVDFLTGYRVDLERLGRACRAKGAYFVVDAIQALGAWQLDVGHGLIDVLACGGQKWLLSPWGSGFVYVRRDLIANLEPDPVSWMSPRGTDDFSRLLQYDATWRDDARRFEFVTVPFQDFAGMNASLEVLAGAGARAIEAHVASLADLIVTEARDAGIELVTPVGRSRRAGLVSLRPKDAVKKSEKLKAAGVAHSLREGAIRLAPHLYNTADEVRTVLKALSEP